MLVPIIFFIIATLCVVGMFALGIAGIRAADVRVCEICQCGAVEDGWCRNCGE